jgi:post-segregation antitoxin (ccd killing protein)
MKTKLTVTIDEELVPRAKRYARGQGVSLSSLIESALIEMTARGETAPFSERWRGAMVLADRDDERYRALAEKYG